MPRPRKCKRVCCLPENNLYGPLNVNIANSEIILMTVDEYETIRLIDLEGLNQEECAARMNAARTTIQRIYYIARKKLAESLVHGKRIQIKGGNYLLCEEDKSILIYKQCCKDNCLRKNRKSLIEGE